MGYPNAGNIHFAASCGVLIPVVNKGLGKEERKELSPFYTEGDKKASLGFVSFTQVISGNHGQELAIAS